MTKAAWTGTISLGMMNLPAQLIPLSSPGRLNARTELIEQQKIRYDEERSREKSSHLIGLRKLGGSHFLTNTPDSELFEPEPHVISLVSALSDEEINPVAFSDDYLVIPTDGALHAFVIFMDALLELGRKEIGTAEIRRRPSACALGPEDGVLHLHLFSSGPALEMIERHLSPSLKRMLRSFAEHMANPSRKSA